ncbi:MAG: preprotein translocase subunit SecE [Armatimonadetes bacterium]|nr:preprotein translocase subunit SecE [Armatimonadota bacterium]
MASNRMPATRVSSGKIKQFIQETWVELRYKVSWPSRTQLLKSTTVVLTVVVVVSIFIYVLDNFFGILLRRTILS